MSVKIKYFSTDEIKTIRDTISDFSLCRKVCIEILLQTGMRVGELILLEWNDINFDEQLITIKTLKQRNTAFRSIDIPSKLVRLLKKWRDHKESDPVRVCKYRSTRGVRHLCDRIQDLTNIEVYPHKFRHNYAIWTLRKHKNIKYLQKQGGWATLDNVRIYLQFMEYDEEQELLEDVF